MAKHGELILRLTAIVLVLLITGPAMSRVAGMRAVLVNKMDRVVEIKCYVTNTSVNFSFRFVNPRRSYIFEIPDGEDFSRLTYGCTFLAPGKPKTSLEVFVGIGGQYNDPCQCLRVYCPWSITNKGFFCKI